MESPPGKEEGASPNAPTPKLTRLALDNSGHTFAQVSGHSNTVTVQEPSGSTYFAKEICPRCGAFLGWLPSPRTIERRTLNGFKLAKLAMVDSLSDWERGFVHDISKLAKLFPKQLRIVDRLAAQNLKGTP